MGHHITPPIVLPLYPSQIGSLNHTPNVMGSTNGVSIQRSKCDTLHNSGIKNSPHL